MQHLIALLVGLIFGIGLIIGGMVNPAKVQGFLDLFGNWDISLALVMGGALLVAGVGFALTKNRATSLCGDELCLPTTKQIDGRLVGGSALFGIGWGIAGICPAPAVILASTGAWQGIVFVAAMVVGMVLFKVTFAKH